MESTEQDPNRLFWAWFLENEEQLSSFEADRERVFDMLSERLASVHPELTFEFGPIIDGAREFVVSAGGIRDAFPAVSGLVAAAPALARWRVIAFRPRRSPINDLTFGDVSIRAEDVRFVAEPDGDHVGLTLLLPGYHETPEKLFEQMGYLFLDEALGEYDVETCVGFVEVTAPASHLDEASAPLSALPRLVDAWRARRTAPDEPQA